MAKGADTTFLVQVEVSESPDHGRARRFLQERVVGARAQLALAPQVLAEFVHIVTDGRRFEKPLDMETALARAAFWWSAREVRQVHPSAEAVELFLTWMNKFQLGRKRLLDTQLAATYYAAGITEIVTSNARDFTVFGCFKVVHLED